MAKYSRFDPRNKKRNKHKSQSIEKDIRIREQKTSKGQKNYLHSPFTVLEYDSNEGEYDDELEQSYPY
jgi:hypothetical protein